ncbi:ribonuclease H-like domain-containing protein [Tanacetum coccineum]
MFFLRDVKFYENIFPLNMKKQIDATPTASDTSQVNTLNFFDTPYFPIKKPTESLSDDDAETDSHGDSENSSDPGGTNEDASDSDSTSPGGFNNVTDRELVTSPYDDITMEKSSTSEDNHNITNVNSDQPSLRKSSRTSKLPIKLSDFVLDDKVAAMNKEIEALHRNETWEIINLPLGRKPISNENEINQVRQFLKADLLIKDLGELKYFLGIEVLRTTDGICMSQRKYCLELLSDIGLLA